MKTHKSMRLIGFMLALVLCFTPCVTAYAQAVDDPTIAVDDKSAMIVEKNVSDSQIISLLNSQTLHPQKTGYAALDKLLDSVLAPYANKSTAEKVKACYAWTIQNIDYSWAGYTAKNSGYDGFKEKYPYNDYEDGLQKAFPEDVIARTYYTMSKHKGVCYDWGAVFAVMVRYIGIDAYVHTGDFKFEESLGFSSTAHGHHGWTEVVLNGKYYIFDPQREYRMTNDGKGTINYSRYFGVTSGDSNYFRYTEETSINDKRDAGFLSVSAHREKFVPVTGIASRSGSVSGSGKYDIGTNVTLTAEPIADKTFEGWFDSNGTLLSTDTSYSFPVTGATTVYAMFVDDLFYDILDESWYLTSAMKAATAGLVSGTAPHRFDGNVTMTRAMATQIIAKLDNADLSEYTHANFTDVPDGKWYTPAIAWAQANNLVSGVGNSKFEPNRGVTREEFVTMIAHYLDQKEIDMKSMDWADVTYTDKNTISNWARDAVCRATATRLISGYPNGSFQPKNNLTRAEGVTIFSFIMDLMTAD